MKRITKILSLLLVFLLTVGVFAGCASDTQTPEEGVKDEKTVSKEDKVVIGMTLRDMTTETFITQNNAMLEVCNKYGWEMVIEDAQMDLSKQIAQIENFMEMGVDYIYVNVFDVAIEDTVKKAVDAGFFVIVHDASFDCASLTFGALDNYEYGYKIGQIAADYINNCEALKNVEEVQWGVHSYTIATDIQARTEGSKAAMAELCPKAKLVAEQDALSLEEAISLTENWVQAYPDLKCVLGCTDSFEYGCDQVFKAAGWDGPEYCLAACDGTQAVFQLIADDASPYRGTVALTLADTSRELIEMLYRHHTGEEIADKLYWGMEIVTKENVADWISK